VYGHGGSAEGAPGDVLVRRLPAREVVQVNTFVL
jgi:hypothetical protein